MKIYPEKTKFHSYAFEFEFDYKVVEYCRHIRKKLGDYEFTFYDKKWHFNDMSAIEMIVGRFPETQLDPVARMQFDMYISEQERDLMALARAAQIKVKESSDIKIRGIKGELYPYQKVGVEFLIVNNGKAILADTMGLGKTLQALAYLTTAGHKKSLIICPASMKYTWEREAKKWTSLKTLVLDSSTAFSVNEYDKNDLFIINYDILKRHGKLLTSYRFDSLVCDEFHYIKNPKAQRTKFVKTIASRIPSVVLLSGTPMLSRPVELFNGLNLMNPQVWNDYWSFTKRYCDGHQGFWGWDDKGASNIAELQSRISRYFLRRTKEEVLKELPPKQFTDIPVDLPAENRTEYNLAVKDFKDYLRKIKKKTDKEVLKALQAEKLVRLSALRQITTKGKIKHAQNTIEDIIGSGQKVVVFSVYNEPLKELKKSFGTEAVLLTGSVDAKERDNIIEKFQKDPKVKVFLGGTKAAGVGITLTSAANVLFIDYSWVPADHAQAADRIHRIGQKASTVNIYQLYSRNTIDDYMCGLLASKKALFDKLIENKDTSDQKRTLTQDLIKMIENE